MRSMSQKLTIALAVVVLVLTAAHAQNYTHTSWTRLFAPTSPFRQNHIPGFTGSEVVYFGGLDNTLQSPATRATYNFDTNAFTTLSTTTTKGRTSAPYIQMGNTVVAFGGYSGKSLSSTTLFLNIVTGVAEDREGSSSAWTVVNPSGALLHTEAPCADPTAAYIGTDMWLFGGLTQFTMLNSLTRINLANNTVYGVEDSAGLRPSRRFATAGGHLKVGVKSYFYLFGGLRRLTSASTPELLGDEYIVDVDTNDWASVSTVLGSSRTLPPARCFAAMVALPNDAGLMLYGGDNGNLTSTVVFDDAWYLSTVAGTDYLQWTKVSYLTSAPSARTKVAALLASNNGEISLIIHGGLTASGSTSNELWKMIFDPCPLGQGKCFTPSDPSGGGTSSSTTSGGAIDTGNSSSTSGIPASNAPFSSGIVSVAPAAVMPMAMRAAFGLLL